MPPEVELAALYNLSDSSDPELHRPTRNELEAQLALIDGVAFDQCYIEGALEDGSPFSACVADGRGGDVVFFIHVHDESFHAVGGSPSDGEPEYALIVSGGQETDTLTRWVVSLDRAAQGLWYFLDNGELDPEMQWDALSAVDFSPPPDNHRVRLPRRP